MTRTAMMRLAVVSGLLGACRPGISTETAPASTVNPSQGEPSQGESAIPWAEGESSENSAREVAGQPRSMDDPMAVDDVLSTEVVVSQPSGRCAGKPSFPLRAEVQARASDLKACGEGVSVTGILRYSLRVEPNGSVDAMTALDDTLDSDQVRRCVQRKLKEHFQERPQGGCVQFVIPVEFERAESVP